MKEPAEQLSSVGWRMHRLTLFGLDENVDAVVRQVSKRSATAWGPNDEILRRLAPLAKAGASFHEILRRAERIVQANSGYELDDVVQNMDPGQNLAFQNRHAFCLAIQRLQPVDETSGITIEISRPGLSLASACPIPHKVAALGLDPIGRLWRRDNWGIDTDILTIGQTFHQLTHASIRYRSIEFAAHGSMPVSAFHAMSIRHPDVLFLMTGQIASNESMLATIDQADGSMDFALYAWTAGECFTSRMIDLSSMPEVRRDFSSDPNGTSRAILHGIEQNFIREALP